jgi:hypothetical protein
MEERTYQVQIDNKTIDVTVKFAYFTYRECLELEAHIAKYDVLYRLPVDKCGSIGQDRERAKYAILHNKVSLMFDSSCDKLTILLKYGTDCGRDVYLTKQLEVVGDHKLLVAIRNAEIASLKRKYDKLLAQSKSAEN